MVKQVRNSLLNYPELFPVAPRRVVLFQLHWQNRSDFRQTEFVGQFGGTSFEEVEAWLTELVERRKGECPEGWVPMVCDEQSEYFVMAPAVAS